MARATEEKLGSLHNKVADIMINALDRAESAAVATQIETEDGSISVGDVSPALLAVAAKFLKDNEITANGGEGSKLGALEDRLAARKRASVGNVTYLDEA